MFLKIFADLVRHRSVKLMASSENLFGSFGTGLSEPIAKMAAIGFISALRRKESSRRLI